MKKVFVVFLLCLISIALTSQTLVEKLENKTNYKEISAIAERHFEDMKARGEARSNGDIKEKHFKRWQWYMRNRLDDQGNVFNHEVKTQAAYEKLKRELPISSARNSVSDWTFTGPSVIPSNPTVITLAMDESIGLHFIKLTQMLFLLALLQVVFGKQRMEEIVGFH